MPFKLAKFGNGPEIFYSIQGEGISAGRPSIFIRSALCNLCCIWCDTPYTWNWKKYDKKEAVVKMAVAEVVSHLKRLPRQGWPCKNLVFTGGEPMLQQLAWIELMRQLKPEGYQFEVETNGTLPIEPEFDTLIDQYNCSPKLSRSKNRKARRETGAFLAYAKNSKAWFKFVVTAPEEMGEIRRFIKKYDLDLERILLMPEGTTKREMAGKSKWVVALAKENGFCFSPRLHIDLWGNKRGA